MADPHERVAGDLTIRIDPTLCVAFGDCVEAAPEAFVIDADGAAGSSLDQRPLAATSCIAGRAARTVTSISRSEWASDRNHASNCEGGR